MDWFVKVAGPAVNNLQFETPGNMSEVLLKLINLLN